MNISKMGFQSDNQNGGRVSKFEISVFRVLRNPRVSVREYLTVEEYAGVARISRVSAYRYWQNLNDRYDGGTITDYPVGRVSAILYETGTGQTIRMFYIQKGL